MNLDALADHKQSLTVPCPLPPYGCGEPTGTPCTRPDGAGGRVPLTNGPAAHTTRLDNAGVVHAPLDPRELARPHERTPRR